MSHASNPSQKRALWLAFWLTALLLFCCNNAPAQTEPKNDPDSIATFINTIAHHVYYLAWPTATYRSVSLNGIERVPGGYDATVRLLGTSAFDDGDLWLKITFQFRDGTLSNVVVRDHNAILAEPFSTVKMLGGVAAQIANDYAAQSSTSAAAAPSPSPPRPQLAATPSRPSIIRSTTPISPTAADSPPQGGFGACITNNTSSPINFAFRSKDQTVWKQWTVPAHYRTSLWALGDNIAAGTPPFVLEYDDDVAPGYTPRTYVLPGKASENPVDCSAVPQYQFVSEDAKIAVHALSPGQQ